MNGARVIAIDGPSASGKSTTARKVATELGLIHLNSGLLYRAITWVVLRDDWQSDGDFEAGLSRLAISLRPVSQEFELRIDGMPAGAWLLAPAVTERVSSVAARADVRRWVMEVLHAATADLGVVVDGRDIGTAVFPEATLKVFLTASPAVRARRRLAEQPDATEDASISAELARLAERDRLDATRPIAPLARAADAIEIDTTKLSPEQVVAKIVGLYAQKASASG